LAVVVYALDRLPEPSAEFFQIQKRAAEELGTTLHYRQIDVRDVMQLNEVVKGISDKEGRMDGLLAAAGIQQETTALDYTAKDANTMFEINITGVFMTAQAVAKEMIRWERGGSMAFVASMSGHVANRVSWNNQIPSVCMRYRERLADNFLSRASSVLRTMPPKQASSSSPRTSPQNGANSAFESTPSPPATS